MLVLLLLLRLLQQLLLLWRRHLLQVVKYVVWQIKELQVPEWQIPADIWLSLAILFVVCLWHTNTPV